MKSPKNELLTPRLSLKPKTIKKEITEKLILRQKPILNIPLNKNCISSRNSKKYIKKIENLVDKYLSFAFVVLSSLL